MAVTVTTSILNATKKLLGIESEYTAFDIDILMHINSTFATLHQLGVGPVNPYEIEGPDNTWDEFILDTPNINSVKTYMYMKVRLAFDPPSTSYAITAMEAQTKEYEWRLEAATNNYTAESGGDRYG